MKMPSLFIGRNGVFLAICEEWCVLPIRTDSARKFVVENALVNAHQPVSEIAAALQSREGDPAPHGEMAQPTASVQVKTS